MIKKVFKPPPPTIDVDTFKALLQKRGVACIRAAIENVEQQQREGKRQRFGNGNANSAACSASSAGESDEASSADHETGAADASAIHQRLRAQQHEARQAKQEELQQLLTRQSALAQQLEALELRLSNVQDDRTRLMQQIKQVCWRLHAH
jgi:hypothetical protein